jgi:hypothetical protein
VSVKDAVTAPLLALVAVRLSSRTQGALTTATSLKPVMAFWDGPKLSTSMPFWEVFK